MFVIDVNIYCLIHLYTQNTKTIQSVILKNIEAQVGDCSTGFFYRFKKMSLIGFEFLLRIKVCQTISGVSQFFGEESAAKFDDLI